jgi:transposase
MKKRTQRDESIEDQSIYKAARISNDVKSFAAKLFIEFERNGMTRKEFLEKMKNAGYKMGKSTLNRYISSVDATGHALSITKCPGPIGALDEEERQIAAGYVFSCNEKNILVHLKDYCDFVKISLNVEISTPTASRYLRDDGFAN